MSVEIKSAVYVDQSKHSFVIACSQIMAGARNHNNEADKS
jgi:hypothetical protein